MNKEWVYLLNIEFDKNILVKFNGEVYERKYPTRLCGICGSIRLPKIVMSKEKPQPEDQYNYKRRKYCSPSCAHKARYLKRKERKPVIKSKPIKVVLDKKEAVIESYLYGRL